MTIVANDLGLQAWQGAGLWSQADLADDESWVVRLSDRDIEEIGAAVEVTRSAAVAIEQISREHFALPRLGPRLRAVETELLEGRGFALLRGLPTGAWSKEALFRAYWGLGTWFGDAVSQNARGHLLGHVIDLRTPGGPAQRVYQTNRAQPFHSDSCDIVGLFCLRGARSGGASAVASAAAIHNDLLESDPEALRCLYGTFHCDRYDEIPAGKRPTYPVRIFNRMAGYLTCCGMDPDIRSAQRLDDLPRLSPDQVAALDAFQASAERHALNMMLEPGDIQLVNNLVVVHARRAFEDEPDPDRRRYMVRLWLSSPRGRPLPAFLAERWGTIEVGARRGGIVVPGSRPVVQLDPDA